MPTASIRIKKKHSVDIRVVHKDDNMILRVKDDCVPFDPAERRAIFNPEDATKISGSALYTGLRMISATRIFWG